MTEAELTGGRPLSPAEKRRQERRLDLLRELKELQDRMAAALEAAALVIDDEATRS